MNEAVYQAFLKSGHGLIAERLKNLNAVDIAVKTGIGKTTIDAFLSNESTELSGKEWERLATALDLSPIEWLRRAGEYSTEVNVGNSDYSELISILGCFYREASKRAVH